MSKKVNRGDSISGEKIAGNALKVLPIRRHQAKKVDVTTLERDAYCIVEEPLKTAAQLKHLPVGASFSLAFEELEAFKIAAEAQYIEGPALYRRSGNHRGQKIRLMGLAYCAIEQEMHWVAQMKPKTPPPTPRAP